MHGSKRHLLWAILAVAALLRLAYWATARDSPFLVHPVMDSQEYDRWAQAIAGGDWLGSQPFFQAPLYPYALALLYAVFGHHLDLAYLLQIGLGVAGIYALYRAGRCLAGEALGLASAALAAVYGPFLFYDVQLLKASFAVAAAAGLLWALAAARRQDRLAGWLVAGLLAGVLSLLRENMLLVVPFLLPLAFTGRPGPRRGSVRALALLAGVAAALLPVAIRNAWVGGGFLPTTYQGGVNFWIGNNPEADGTYRPLVPGKQIPRFERSESTRLAERDVGHRLSPREVSRYWLGKALTWAAREPRAFARLQARKLAMFWSFYEWPDAVDYYYLKRQSPILGLPLLEFGGASLLALLGLWLARHRLASFLPALLFTAGWTASTVAFFLFSRYRLPVVPALLLLAGVPLAELARRLSERRLAAASGLALAVALSWAAPQLAGYAPRMDLVHDNLGRIAEEEGRPEVAARHYRAALAEDPENLLALLNLGTQAAREGRYKEAQGFFARAVAAAPGSDDAESDLGGALLALGRLEEAEAHLARALALDPGNLFARTNLAVLRQRQGRPGDARALLGEVLARDPGNAAARRLLDRLPER